MPMPATCGGRAADGDGQGEGRELRKTSHGAVHENVQKQGRRGLCAGPHQDYQHGKEPDTGDKHDGNTTKDA